MPHSLDHLAELFRRFSKVESQQMSPFYSHIAGRIADDPELLEMAAQTRPGQPPPNMLLGAVRFLLDQGKSPYLLSQYPTETGPIDSDLYPSFRKFVLDSSDDIISILECRSVQSNVVRRAAVLLLGLLSVAERLGGKPFGHVEIGASLGLTLLWTHFSYDFGNGFRSGPTNSTVKITTTISGRVPFAIGTSMPTTVSDTGIELSPVDLSDQEDVAWLEALIWPEHEDNRQLWRAAIPLAMRHPPRVLPGDANDVLPDLLAALPAGMPASVYHSHTLNQFTTEARERLQDVLTEASLDRRVFRLSFEGEGPHSALRLFEYSNGVRTDETHLADCEPHGRWIKWH